MSDGYTLTRAMADKVVGAISSDPNCRKLMPALSAYRFFAPNGHAGTARNMTNAFIIGLADIDKWVQTKAGFAEAGRRTYRRWEDAGDRQACTGIATATSRVLNKLARKPGFEFLQGAGPQDRLPSDPMKDFHTATQVTVDPGKTYVFDWHATLSVGCPLIFPSPTAFKAGRPVVKYPHFWGWS